jgi:ribulose-phosphate 3-epimerase
MTTTIQRPTKRTQSSTKTIQSLTKRKAWKALTAHFKNAKELHLRDLFAADPKRGEKMILQAAGLYLDYSKNRVTDETLKLLFQLATESGLKQRIDSMFKGEKINITEKRAVLHTALSMGAPIVKSLRPITRLPLETHLMISDPDFFFDEFVGAGSDSFIVHWEGNNNLHRTIQRVKSLGKKVGLAINPATPASVLEEVLPDLDLVLVMTVNPGFGHQHFIHSMLPKIQRVRQMIEQSRSDCELELDGGIDPATAPLGVAAGANVLVAGSSIFGDRLGVDAAMKKLRTATADIVNKEKENICA